MENNIIELLALKELKEEVEKLRTTISEKLLEIDAFSGMDEILSEIDQKNTRYQRAAINRAGFLLPADSGNDRVYAGE